MTKDEALKLALEALENVAVTGPDDDGIVWINLPGNGTTGKAILRVGKAGLIAAQCAQLYEEQRTKAITAIKQALAAPVQEPVAKTFGEENVELGVYSDAASNGQQRELVGEVEMGQLVGYGAHKSASNPDAKGEIAVIRGVDEYGPMIGWYEHWVNFPVGTKFYTTPPAAPVQEPVAKVVLTETLGLPCLQWLDLNRQFDFKGGEYLYTVPPNVATPPAAQRTWVGLTDEEMQALWDRYAHMEMMRAIEAKLKEKNT
jgi:hypothetical protein